MMSGEAREAEVLTEVRGIRDRLRLDQKQERWRTWLAVLVLLVFGAPSWYSVSGEFRVLRHEILLNREATRSVADQVREDAQIVRLAQQEIALQAQRLDTLAAALQAVERRLNDRPGKQRYGKP